MSSSFKKYLQPTPIIDSDNSIVLKFLKQQIDPWKCDHDPIKTAVALYYCVRDKIQYNPYSPFFEPENYRASSVIKSKMGFCISKASLLCALGRACQIPARLGFATVKNHLATEKLIQRLGSNIFVYHGYTEFYLEGKWVKATPAFDRILCKHHGVEPLEFNGRDDSILQPYNLKKNLFMEYITEHGSYADVPVAIIVQTFKDTYGEQRVQSWIEEFQNPVSIQKRDFLSEKPITV